MTDHTPQRFGALRSIMQQPPSLETWRALQQYIQALPEDAPFDEMLRPYILSHLKNWPLLLRTISTHTLLKAIEGDVLADRLLRCARCTSESYDADEGREELLELLTDGASSHPRAAHIGMYSGDHGPLYDALIALNDAEHCPTSLFISSTFDANPIGVALCVSEIARHLERVVLEVEGYEAYCTDYNNAFSDGALAPNLHTIAATYYPLAPRELEAMAVQKLPALRRLALPVVAGGGLRHLARNPLLGQLTHLSLDVVMWPDESADFEGYREEHEEFEADSEGERPGPDGSTMTDRDVMALASSRFVEQLEVLHLEAEQLTPVGLRALLTSRSLHRLHTLRISAERDAFGDDLAALEALAHQHMPALQTIELISGRSLIDRWDEAGVLPDWAKTRRDLARIVFA